MAKIYLCADCTGIPRGECRACETCAAFRSEKHQKLSLKVWDSAESSGSSLDVDPQKRRQALESPCEACGCAAHQHRSLEDLLSRVRVWAQKLHAQVPDLFDLPVAAQFWEPEAAALFLATDGQFDPRRDSRKCEAGVGHLRDESLVSVVCTSTEKDHTSHALLYECFRKQTYECRELIVIDTGTEPSLFLQEKAKADPRVVYRFFFREEHGLEQDEDSLEHVMCEDKHEEVTHFVTWTPDFSEKFDGSRSEVPCQGLTLGMKRNIAVHLARGSIIMHFCIGDLYSKDYVASMRSELIDAAYQPRAGPLAPAAVALGDWHAVDLTSRAFRQLDLAERGHHLPEEMRRSLQRDRGFTYAYTRKAWELVVFPNVEQPEGQLAKVFHENRVPFQMVEPACCADGLAARGYDKAHITGASIAASMNIAIEIRDLVDCSKPVDTPSAFAELLPVVELVSSTMRKVRDGRINDLLAANGAAFFCIHCDAAVALKQYLKEERAYGDGAGGSLEIARFSRAGGAVAEGQDHPEECGQETPVGRVARLRLSCASLGCPHRVHGDLDLGGYCCAVCYESRGWQHGPRCERAAPPTTSHRADACCLPRGAGPRVQADPELEMARLPLPVPDRVPGNFTSTRVVPFVVPKDIQARTLTQQLCKQETKSDFLPPPLDTANYRLRRTPVHSATGSLKPLISPAGNAPASRTRPAQPGVLPQQQRSLLQLDPGPQGWKVPPSRAQPAQPARAPEPVKITWFPGWSWRNALCRHCGKCIGWRYEKSGGVIFWAFEQKHLMERLPQDAGTAQAAAPVKETVPPARGKVAAQAASVGAAAAKAAAAEVEAATEQAATVRVAAAQDFAAEAAAVKVAVEEADRHGLITLAWESLACFSSDLLEQLASTLRSASGKFAVDQALGALKLDDPTREKLLEQIDIKPEAAPLQADIWISKGFRGKVYNLRKLDAKVLHTVVKDVMSSRLTKAAESSQGKASSSTLPFSGQATAPSLPAPKSERAKEPAEGGREKVLNQKGSSDAGSQAICAFSAELQQQLACGIAGSDGSNFDQALNKLKLDDATRDNLRQELMIRPGVAAMQVEQLVAKSFRSKVNALRSLGLRKLRAALAQALPEDAPRV